MVSSDLELFPQLLKYQFSVVPWPPFFLLARVIKQDSLILSLFVNSQFMVKSVYRVLVCVWMAP